MAEERSKDGWTKTYRFDELDIGESVEITGVEGNIRSAASMWGTRYSIWLQVKKIDDGRMMVTRLEAAAPNRRKKPLPLRELLYEMTKLMLEIKRLIEEKE